MTTIKMELNKESKEYWVKVSIDCPENEYMENVFYIMGLLTATGKCKIVAVDFDMEYFVIDSYDSWADELLAEYYFTADEVIEYDNYSVWTYTYNK